MPINWPKLPHDVLTRSFQCVSSLTEFEKKIDKFKIDTKNIFLMMDLNFFNMEYLKIIQSKTIHSIILKILF